MTHVDTRACTQELTSGKEVLDGIDSACRRRLCSSQGSVGKRGLEHAQLLQALMGKEKRKHMWERKRDEADESLHSLHW